MQLTLLDIPANKIKQLEKKGIESIEDLLATAPIGYNDFRHPTGILPPDKISVIDVTVTSVKLYWNAKDMIIARCVTSDGKNLSVSWFNQRYMYSKLCALTGKKVRVAAKIKYNPDYSTFETSSPVLFSDDESLYVITPRYSKVPGMANDYFAGCVEEALDYVSGVEDVLPPDIVKACGYIPMVDASRQLHMPNSDAELAAAKKRFVFNDLCRLAVENKIAATESAKSSSYIPLNLTLMETVRKALPYELTEDQDKVLNDMLAVCRSGKRLSALLQGDVGSGKTITALLLALAFIGSGYQAAIMAPTQILAKQHYANITALLDGFGVKIAFLSGELSKKERRSLLAGIESGETQLVIGTHAVISNDVVFHNLALASIDEEHRFGVVQRAALRRKACDGVHILNMSATPIPKSLASALYADENVVEVFNIHSMPLGRLPVATGIVTDKIKLYGYLKREIFEKKHQVFVVCPAIDESEALISVREMSEEYMRQLPGAVIMTLTGRNSPEETERIFGQFNEHKIDVLISTTVIEVGVDTDCENIVIMQPDRFGLAQLHQLRGRVGRRAGARGCCAVVPADDASEKSMQRLEAFCSINDGFELAEVDLKLRGAGDFVGTGVRQSGRNHLLELAVEFPKEYEKAKAAVSTIFADGISCPLIDEVVNAG